MVKYTTDFKEKNMKKIVALVLVAIMAMAMFTACGSEADVKGPEGTPAEIIDKIYAEKSIELPLMTMDVDLTDKDAVLMQIGLESAEKVKEAAVSESMMGSQAYSLVVVRVNDAADAEEVAKAMQGGIDQRKWICVEADDLRVAACGDVIMLFMVASDFADTVTAEEMVEAFKTVCGGKLTVDLQ